MEEVKIKINVHKELKKMDAALSELKKNLPIARLSAEEKAEIQRELEEAIVLAEKLKKQIGAVGNR
jgi:hypothetical protein